MYEPVGPMSVVRPSRLLRGCTFLTVLLVPTSGSTRGADAARRAAARCSQRVAVSVVKLSVGVLRCHVRAASLSLRGKDFSEEPCENPPRARYDAATARHAGCPACLDAVTIGDRTMSDADSIAGGAIYCDPRSGRHIGDDTAFLPADRATAKCENRVSANLGVLLRAAYKCRRLAAKAQLKSQPFDEAGCEASAKVGFDAANAALTGCPACLDAPALGADMLSDVAVMSMRIFCAQ